MPRTPKENPVIIKRQLWLAQEDDQELIEVSKEMGVEWPTTARIALRQGLKALRKFLSDTKIDQ